MAVGNGGLLDGLRRIGAKVRDLSIDGGLPGAALGYRLRGATQAGAPVLGTWRTGDVVFDRSGAIWTCTAGGTPGTWALGTASNLAGAATFPARVTGKVVTLTDGSSVALDASLGNLYRWPLGGSSHTLANPSNLVDGDVFIVRIIYSGSFTPLFNAAYEFGTDGQPAWSATSGKIDEIGFAYNADANSGSGALVCRGWKLGYS